MWQFLCFLPWVQRWGGGQHKAKGGLRGGQRGVAVRFPQASQPGTVSPAPGAERPQHARPHPRRSPYQLCILTATSGGPGRSATYRGGARSSPESESPLGGQEGAPGLPLSGFTSFPASPT